MQDASCGTTNLLDCVNARVLPASRETPFGQRRVAVRGEHRRIARPSLIIAHQIFFTGRATDLRAG